MIKIKKYEKIDNLIFCPKVTEVGIKEEWISEFNDGIKKSISIVKEYIDVKRLPRFVFLNEELTNVLKKELKLKYWVKAFTIDETIYFMWRYPTIPKWRNILSHELFHTVLNQNITNSKVVPVWFNESIAYHIGRKEKESLDASFLKLLPTVINDIKIHIEKDTLLYEYPDWNNVVKVYGTFFCHTYGPDTVKRILNAAAGCNNINKAFVDVIGISVEETVNQMAAWAEKLQ